MSGKRAKAARRAAARFESRFDKAFEAQKAKAPWWLPIAAFFVADARGRWEQEIAKRLDPRNEAYKKASMKRLARIANAAMRGNQVR